MSTPDGLGIVALPCKHRHSGFTLVEMVAAIIIFAILAATVLPRFFDREAFDTRVFYDQAQSMLRHGQKIAIAQNRSVYVRMNDGVSIAFCFVPFVGTNCANRVPAPLGENSASAKTLAACGNSRAWFCEAAPAGVSYVAATDFYFDASGQPFYPTDTPPVSSFATRDIVLTGGGSTRHIYIEAETGYVHP